MIRFLLYHFSWSFFITFETFWWMQGHGTDVDYIEPTVIDLGSNLKAVEVSCGFNHTGAIYEYLWFPEDGTYVMDKLLPKLLWPGLGTLCIHRVMFITSSSFVLHLRCHFCNIINMSWIMNKQIWVIYITVSVEQAKLVCHVRSIFVSQSHWLV